jgi:hypothetical protein
MLLRTKQAVPRSARELRTPRPTGCTWPLRTATPPRAAGTAEARIDVAAKLRAQRR